jgi:hypothetical protein
VIAEGAALVDDQHLALARRSTARNAVLGPWQPRAAAPLGQQRLAPCAQERERAAPFGEQARQRVVQEGRFVQGVEMSAALAAVATDDQSRRGGAHAVQLRQDRLIVTVGNHDIGYLQAVLMQAGIQRSRARRLRQQAGEVSGGIC